MGFGEVGSGFRVEGYTVYGCMGLGVYGFGCYGLMGSERGLVYDLGLGFRGF